MKLYSSTNGDNPELYNFNTAYTLSTIMT